MGNKFTTMVLVILAVSLVACAGKPIPAAITPTATSPLPVSTPVPSPTSTQTGIPTATQIEIPTATITPASIATEALDPLALNEVNAGTQMKRLAIFGTGEAHDLAWSPDGNILAVATARGAWLYDGTTFEKTGFIDVNDSVSTLAFSPDGLILALAVNGKVSLWSVQSGQKIKNLDNDLITVYKLAYGKGGQIAVWGSVVWSDAGDFKMILWDGASGQEILSEDNIVYYFLAPVFSPDGRILAYRGRDSLKLVEAKTGKLIASKNATPWGVGFSPDGSKLFLVHKVAYNSVVGIWDFVHEQVSPLNNCDKPVAWGNTVMVCGVESEINLLDLSTGNVIRQLDIKPTDYGNALRPDGSLLAMIDSERNVKIFDTNDGQQVKTIEFTNFVGNPYDLAITAGMATLDGKSAYLAATTNRSGDVQLWDIPGGQIVRTLKNGPQIFGLAFSPDQRTLASLDHAGILKLWDVQASSIKNEFDISGSVLAGGTFAGSIAFSPDGLHLAMIGTTDDIFLFDLQTSEITYFGPTYLLSGVRDKFMFTPSGDLLSLNLSSYGDFSLVNIASGKVVLPLPASYHVISNNQARGIDTAAINLNGRYVAFGTDDGKIHIWDIPAQKLVNEFIGHKAFDYYGTYSIQRLAFSPQSNLLASVGFDETTRLWNALTGAPRAQLNVCCYADFTADGRYLVTAGEGVIRVWGIPAP